MCLGSTIAEKIEKLDEIDHRIIAVSPFTSIFSLFIYLLEHLIICVIGDRQMVSKASLPIFVIHHPVY